MFFTFLFGSSLFISLFTLYLALLSLFETFFSHFIKLTTFQPIVRKRIDFLGISHFSVCLTEKEGKICSFCFVLNQLIDLNPLLYFIIHFVFTFRCTKCRVFFTLAFGWQRFHFMLNNRIFSLPLHYFTLLLVFFPLFAIHRTQWIFKSLSNSTIYRFSMHVLSIGLISLFFLFCCCNVHFNITLQNASNY